MDVLMPQLGETVAEGKITKWFKSAGDAVKPGDNLFEIETDKVSMEVPSTTAGVLAEIRVPRRRGGAGRRRGGGDLGWRRRAPQARQPAAPPKAPVSPSRAAEPPPAPRAASSRAGAARVPLDPFFEVRTPARNYGPARLAGRHPGHAAGAPARRRGRHRSRQHRAVGSARPHRGARRRGGDGREARGRGAARAVARARALGRRRSWRSTATCRSRRCRSTACARPSPARLVQAKQTIPHFYLTADVEIGRLLALREEANAAAPKDRDGKPAFKLSVNDLVIKAWAAALQRVPAANAVWAEDRILRFKHSDIGVAVAIEGGLLTPVIRQAEQKIALGDLERDEGRWPRARESESSSPTNTRAARRRSPISACTACASSPPSSIRRTRPSWRSAPRAGRRSRRRTAASASSA